MSEPIDRTASWRTSAALTVFSSSIVLAVLVLVADRPRVDPVERPPEEEDAGGDAVDPTSIEPGVRVRISGSGTRVARRLPTPSFTVEPGSSLDARIPPGAFEAAVEVGFDPKWVRRAAFGVEYAGGSVRLEAGGRVLLDEAAPAGGGGRTVFAGPIEVARPLAALSVRFASDGRGAARLRVLWIPDGHRVAHPVPATSPEWIDDPLLAGEVALQVHQCASCHPSSDPARHASLSILRGPDLGQAGARLRPGWIRRWLADPSAMKRGTAMPRLFGDDEGSRRDVEDLTHFLASLGGPTGGEAAPDPNFVATGRIAYSTIGCAPCHGDLEGRPATGREPLGLVAAKWNPAALAAFLRDPTATRPRGRMPRMAIGELESRALAAYLIDRTAGPVDSERFAPDPERVRRGREAYARRRCGACHDLGKDDAGEGLEVPGPPLEALRLGRGCLDPVGGAGARYDLDARERDGIAAWLGGLADRRAGDVPLDRLGAALVRGDCLACHEYAGTGGPSPDLERFFTSTTEADLGDEGRFPPALTDVGARLTLHWLTEVLEREGRIRPWLGVRMPGFSESGRASLARDLVRAAGVGFEGDDGPEPAPEAASIGRHLVGVGGHDCINCHTISGKPSTGTPGPDLAGAAERLRYDYFVRWLHRPTALRPRTRMPTFFEREDPAEASARIDAIWAYLSLGRGLPLPDGLGRGRSLVLDVAGDPIVLRTFMKGIGPRAIACGYPEGVHLAYDADQARLRFVWTGSFLDASGAWAGRGGQETNPAAAALWTAPEGPAVVVAAEAPEPWPAKVEAGRVRFRGYRLDDRRRPAFLSEVDGVRIEERPVPERRDGKVSLRRRLVLAGAPGTVVWIRGPRGPVRVELPEDGRAELELEVPW